MNEQYFLQFIYWQQTELMTLFNLSEACLFKELLLNEYNLDNISCFPKRGLELALVQIF